MAENLDIPRQVVIATEIDPQTDYDVHYTICHLHPDDIQLIADAVVARLTPTYLKPNTDHPTITP